jgi:hypothetical protein
MDLQSTLTLVGSILTSVVTVASAICAITPTPNPTTKWGKIYMILEFLAINIGKAKDKGVAGEQPKQPDPPAVG